MIHLTSVTEIEHKLFSRDYIKSLVHYYIIITYICN